MSMDATDKLELLCGFSKLLFETSLIQDLQILSSLLKMITLILTNKSSSKAVSIIDDENFLQDENDLTNREFDSTYSKLAYAQMNEPTALPMVVNAEQYFLQNLMTFCQSHGNFVTQLQSIVGTDDFMILQQLAHQNGFKLV
jgi:hypothetical protein